MKVLQAWKSSSWKVKTLIILASLYLLYALFGFLLAPGLVRDLSLIHISEPTRPY